MSDFLELLAVGSFGKGKRMVRIVAVSAQA